MGRPVAPFENGKEWFLPSIEMERIFQFDERYSHCHLYKQLTLGLSMYSLRLQTNSPMIKKIFLSERHPSSCIKNILGVIMGM